MQFYGIAAQVIPVLCLAIVFEERMLHRKPASYQGEKDNPQYWNATQIVARIYLTLLVTAGEVAALVGLYRQETSWVVDALIWLAIIVALCTLVVAVLSPQWKYWRQWWSTEAKSWWLSAGTLFALIVLTGALISWFE